MGLSAVVITLNEEHNIERCLRSLAFADEIVVVDSFSSDRTVELARQHTDNVTQREFSGFSDQWSAAIELAANEWVLIVAADEVVTRELAKEITVVVERGEADGFRIPRLSYFLGRPIRHCGWYPDYQLRLARKSKARFADRLVHEKLEVDGRVETLRRDILHYSYVTMDDYVRKMAAYSRAAAAQKAREGARARLPDFIFRPGITFLRKYLLQQGFRDGVRGLLLSGLTAYSVLLRYAILWDLRRRQEELSQDA